MHSPSPKWFTADFTYNSGRVQRILLWADSEDQAFNAALAVVPDGWQAGVVYPTPKGLCHAQNPDPTNRNLQPWH